jgi:hypothetical protein
MYFARNPRGASQKHCLLVAVDWKGIGKAEDARAKIRESGFLLPVNEIDRGAFFDYLGHLAESFGANKSDEGDDDIK